MKAKPEEMVMVLEVWGPNGEHYLRFPNGMEWEVPKVRAATKPDDYVFHDGRWQPPATTSAKNDE